MQAVIRTGGKQYTVSEGDILRIERLDGETGSSIEIGEVLSVGEGDGLKVGTPTVPDARVVAEIVEQGKAKKIVVFKKKRRKGYKKKQGHRQLYTSIRIKDIRA